MAMNILIIRLKSIGDILFTLPAVHLIRENFPHAKLHFLVAKENAGLVRGFSEIDEIIPLDRSPYRSINLLNMGAATVKFLHLLRRKKFQLVIDFQGYGETGFLSWWTGAAERWGGVNHAEYGWASTHYRWHTERLHSAERNLALLEQCGLKAGTVRNEYALSADVLKEAKQLFVELNPGAAKPVLFIQPFTSTPHKNWPLEKYLALARHWESRGGQIIFGGGPADRPVLEPARTAGFHVSAGTSLPVSAGLVKLSALTVGGDTGLLHLGVAMGKRVVMLMKSNAPAGHIPFVIPIGQCFRQRENQLPKFQLPTSLMHVIGLLLKLASNRPANPSKRHAPRLRAC